MKKIVTRSIALLSGGALLLILLTSFLFTRSSVNTLKSSYTELSPVQVDAFMEGLPPSIIIKDQELIHWNVVNHTFTDGLYCQQQLAEGVTLNYIPIRPKTQLFTTLLFILFSFFFIQRIKGLRTRNLEPKKLVAPFSVALGGLIILWLLRPTLGSIGVPIQLWIMIWGAMSILLYSADVYGFINFKKNAPFIIGATSLIGIALSSSLLLKFHGDLSSTQLSGYGQLQHWLTKIVSVVAILSLHLVFTRLIRATFESLKTRVIGFMVSALIIFIISISFASWFIALSLALLGAISMLLMDVTVEEKRINFLWLTAWILVVATYTTLLWVGQEPLEILGLTDAFNYFSLTFVGSLGALLVMILINTFVPTLWGWRSIKFPSNLLLRHKIELTTLGTLCIAFISIGLVTYILETHRERSVILEQLGAIQYGAPSDFILQDGFQMRRFEEGDLYWDPRDKNHKVDLPPYRIWNSQDISRQPVIEGHQAFWREGNGAIAAFRPNQQSFVETFGRSLISKLFNLYVFLFLICLGIVYLVAQSMTRPLSFLGEQLEQISLGRVNPKIEWNTKDEVGQLIGRYNNMLEQLDESAQALAHTERDQAWKEMAKQVAHEIKNPLTPMRLAIQHLQMKTRGQEGPIPGMVQKTAQTLIEQIDNMTRIAENFSQFGELPKVSNERVLLNDVVTSVHDLFRKREDMIIKCRVPIDDCYVFADKDHLLRIFNNIIKNAIQAIPRDRRGEIIVKLERKEHHAMVSITDNGEGIPDDRIKKVFQPNFTTKRSGTGLGLAMCAKMIESMDGNIYFETEVEVGTTFYVEIPLLRIEENYQEQEIVL